MSLFFPLHPGPLGATSRGQGISGSWTGAHVGATCWERTAGHAASKCCNGKCQAAWEALQGGRHSRPAPPGVPSAILLLSLLEGSIGRLPFIDSEPAYVLTTVRKIERKN